MALAAAIAAAVVEFAVSDRSKLQHIPFMSYSKAAASCALASPLGYASLKYIRYMVYFNAEHLYIHCKLKLFEIHRQFSTDGACEVIETCTCHVDRLLFL